MNLLNLGAIDISSICTQMSDVIELIGYVLLVVKIAIPLIIIAFGIFDFGKAVVAEKEDEIKKYAKRLIFRVVAGIVIFLIPSIVLWLFGLNKDYSTQKDKLEFEKCEKCFLEPWNC